MGLEQMVLRKVPMAGELEADDLQSPFQPKPHLEADDLQGPFQPKRFCESMDSLLGFTGEKCSKAEAVIKYLRLGI